MLKVPDVVIGPGVIDKKPIVLAVKPTDVTVPVPDAGVCHVIAPEPLVVRTCPDVPVVGGSVSVIGDDAADCRVVFPPITIRVGMYTAFKSAEK